MVSRGPYVPKALLDDLKNTLTAEIPERVTSERWALTPEQRAAKARELQAQRKRYYDRDQLMLDLWSALMHHATDAFAATKEFQALRVRYLRIAPSDHQTSGDQHNAS
jgi:hypothetical protein